jgi:hypothetical protein
MRTQSKFTPSARAESVQRLGDLGVAWAAHGLHLGALAVEMSAKTVATTARLLALMAAEVSKLGSTPADIDQPATSRTSTTTGDER